MKTAVKKSPARQAPSPNRLCGSCRRTCKQTAAAVVAQCPRYYPFKTKASGRHEFTWKQLELTF